MNKIKYMVPLNIAHFENLQLRDGFGKALLELGKINENIVALTADLKESTRVEAFAEAYPERFFEVGVAEQNLVGIAAGMALSGKIPFITSFAVFSPGRTWDQIRVSICYSNANVKIIGSHAGLGVGPDGATHQALEDIGMLRSIPNLVIVAPSDKEETRKATKAIANYNGPCYLRFSRDSSPQITNSQTPFEIGKAIHLVSGDDVTIIANGNLVSKALEAARDLKDKISISVINMHTIKPIDKKAIITAAKATGAIVTAEEHQKIGGLGSAVAEVLSEHHPIPLEIVGVNNSFGESGQPNELYEKYGLEKDDIISAVEKVLKRK